jgi:hypothetical protein
MKHKTIEMTFNEDELRSFIIFMKRTSMSGEESRVHAHMMGTLERAYNELMTPMEQALKEKQVEKGVKPANSSTKGTKKKAKKK